jgi:hypothetical protein
MLARNPNVFVFLIQGEDEGEVLCIQSERRWREWDQSNKELKGEGWESFLIYMLCGGVLNARCSMLSAQCSMLNAQLLKD